MPSKKYLEKFKHKEFGDEVTFYVFQSRRAAGSRIAITEPNIVRLTIPKYLPKFRFVLNKLIISHKDWINKTLQKFNKINLNKIRLPAHISKSDKILAKGRLEQRVRELALQHNIKFNKIYIRNQKSRWGSCSSKQNLSFNWRLILLPKKITDYVIYHELIHLKHHNHFKAFWSDLIKIYPETMELKKQLKNYIVR